MALNRSLARLIFTMLSSPALMLATNSFTSSATRGSLTWMALQSDDMTSRNTTLTLFTSPNTLLPGFPFLRLS